MSKKQNNYDQSADASEICSYCGSANVARRVWLGINDGMVYDLVEGGVHPDWCHDCDEEMYCLHVKEDAEIIKERFGCE